MIRRPHPAASAPARRRGAPLPRRRAAPRLHDLSEGRLQAGGARQVPDRGRSGDHRAAERHPDLDRGERDRRRPHRAGQPGELRHRRGDRGRPHRRGAGARRRSRSGPKLQDLIASRRGVPAEPQPRARRGDRRREPAVAHQRRPHRSRHPAARPARPPGARRRHPDRLPRAGRRGGRWSTGAPPRTGRWSRSPPIRRRRSSARSRRPRRCCSSSASAACA